jgi:hypothetical protein
MRSRSAMLPPLPAVGLGLALLVSCSAPLHADATAGSGPWTLARGEWSTELRGNFFSSDTYHDQDGTRLWLAGGGLIEQRSLTWAGELGWKRGLTLVYSVPFVSLTRRPDGNAYVPTVTGFGDAVFGFKLHLRNGARAAALEVDWKAPFGYERAPTYFADDTTDINRAKQLGEPRLGDGQQDVSAVLHMGSAIGSRGFAQVAGGYTYRFEDPADQIVLRADLGLWVSGDWMLAGRYRGQVAMSGDNDTRDPDRHLVGPLLIYRVDDHLDLFAGSMHTAKAVNAPHTDEYMVGMTFKQTKLDRLQGYLGTARRP